MNMDETPLAAAVKSRIMIVDDHPIVHESMAQFLNAQPDLDLCCHASHVGEALERMPSCNPALVIVDISLKQESGLSLIKTLRRSYSHVGLLAMSQHDEMIFAERALRAGANGYLMKQAATSNILKAIRHVLAGDVYLSSAMHSQITRSLTSPGAALSNPMAGLTDREFEVLHLLGLGFSTRQIAEELKRSMKTIEAHRDSLKDKLKLDNATDLTHFACRL
jgi:DNA-binding NarL/FixJ family response regulator